MIVLAIIAAMLLITLQISSNQTRELRFRLAREWFRASYNAFILKAMTTNNWSMKLLFTPDDGKPIVATWDGSELLVFEDLSTMDITSFNGLSWSSFTPQSLVFNTTWSSCNIYNGSILVASSWIIPFVMKYLPVSVCSKCYEINLSTCKLREVKCNPLPTNC